jgi:hypothetical protein
VISRTVVVDLLCLGIVAGVVVVWQRTHRDTGAARVSEAHQLETAGQEVVDPETADQLQSEVDELTAANDDLHEALDAAREAAPNTKIVYVTRATTGPVLAGGVPSAQDGPSTPPAADPSCLLSAGDRGEVRVDEITLETTAGNRLLVGAASAWRLDPERRLFGGPFSAPLTEAAAVEPPQAQPWPGLRDYIEMGGGLLGGILLTVAVRR